MTEPVFVDTSVWVCAVDAADPARRERALEITAPVPNRDLVISMQVLAEFYAVVTREPGSLVSVEDAEAMVRQPSVLPVVAIDSSLVFRRSPGAVNGRSRSGTPSSFEPTRSLGVDASSARTGRMVRRTVRSPSRTPSRVLASLLPAVAPPKRVEQVGVREPQEQLDT